MQNLVHNDYCQCYLFISGKKMNYNGKKSNNLIFKKQFCNYIIDFDIRNIAIIQII